MVGKFISFLYILHIGKNLLLDYVDDVQCSYSGMDYAFGIPGIWATGQKPLLFSMNTIFYINSYMYTLFF